MLLLRNYKEEEETGDKIVFLRPDNKQVYVYFSTSNNGKLNIQQKTTLVGFINKTTQLIPLLTNDNLMEMDTKIKIKEMTDELKLLSSNFKKKDYPFETQAEKNERQKAISEQGKWGIIKVQAGTGSIENTLEVPLVPATDKGLKFHTAAEAVSYTHLTLPTNREV